MLQIKALIAIFFVLISFSAFRASNVYSIQESPVFTDSVAHLSDESISTEQKRKRRIAAICAFPFPFGFVGTHRVLLGTKPWVPVVYVATFGGGFGLLPLVDFILIVSQKDLIRFENNPRVFMGIK